MVDNTALNQECNKLQPAFWGNEDAKISQQGIKFHEWLNEVDTGWKQNSKNIPEEVDELYKKLLTSSRFFVNFSEPFLVGENTEEDTSKSSSPNSILARYLETYIDVMEQGAKIDETNATVKGFWKLPLELWQQQLKLLGELPDSFLQFVKASSDESLQDTEFVTACEQYFEILQGYQSAYLAMSLNAAKEMMERLETAESSSESVSQQACTFWMDTWIDVFEKHYAIFVSDSDYSKLYAEVVNSWMLVIQQTQRVITPWLKAMNIPTSDDV